MDSNGVNMVTETDLKRLEDKLDKLTDAVMRLVILEERQTHQTEQIAKLSETCARQQTQINYVERRVDKWINRGIGAWGLACVLYTVVELIVKKGVA